MRKRGTEEEEKAERTVITLSINARKEFYNNYKEILV